LWLAEGLLHYLPEVAPLLSRIDALSASGSVLLTDVGGRSLLESPIMKSRMAALEKLGAPWRFGTEEPESLLPASWDTQVHDIAAVGIALGRWPYPPVPRGTPNVPQSFLLDAIKR
jgi:O-methyltransferase involved in polyketide biosynthesis